MPRALPIFVAAGLLCLLGLYCNPLTITARVPVSPQPLQASGRLTGASPRRSRLARNSLTRSPPPSLSLQRLESPPPPPASSPALTTVIDPTCHPAEHTDYIGERAVVWGMSFHVRDAAECCAACQAHAAACGGAEHAGISWWAPKPELRCGNNPRCNMWVFCPEEQCFAFDIHKHTKGECWLKQQSGDVTRPKDPHEGHKRFPQAMRLSPRKTWPWAVEEKIWPGEMPEKVPWISGVLAPAAARIVSAKPDDKWRERWCNKYGPCDQQAGAGAV